MKVLATGRYDMVELRSFDITDAQELQLMKWQNMSIQNIQSMICEWNTLNHNGKYFEMFAVLKEENLVGTISIYEHSKNIVSIGPEIFEGYRKCGYAKQAMLNVMEVAKKKGYSIVKQQIRADNTASIKLHQSLEYETDGYVYKNRKSNDVLIYLKSLK